LFGSKYDQAKYQKVIKLCQLENDLAAFPGGDLTELGQRGENLSGGQKARISLARAVYRDAQVIVMDDPISALDKKVMSQIFAQLFLKELKNKTRILVTHSVDYLQHFDKIVLIKKGKIEQIGTYEEVKDNYFLERLREFNNSIDLK